MNPYDYICDLQVKSITSAQESIETALFSLYEEKEIYQISVKELCVRANVARSTFYTYYDVIDDCLLEIENRMICEIVALNDKLIGQETIHKSDMSFYDKTILYIRENQKKLYLFLVKRPNYRFINKWKDGIKYHLFNRIPKTLNEKNKELTLELIACEAIGAYQYGIQNPYDIDSEYVKNLIWITLNMYIGQ